MPAAPPPANDEAQPTEAGPRYHDDGSRSASDPVLGRQVAVQRTGAAGADVLEHQARAQARLEHGSIPPVYDFVRNAAGAVLVTRQVRGITLAEAVADARAGTIRPEITSAAEAMQVMRRVTEALMAAHGQGVVHRHLTPACITLAPYGEVLVGGWEQGANADGETLSRRYTGTATRLQALDDLHIDLRAVGLCLFEALVRRPPRADGDPFADVGEVEGALLCPRVCTLIRTAMRSGSSSGFRSAEELHRALADCIAAEAGDAAPATRYRPGRRRSVLLAGALIAIAIAGWLAWPARTHGGTGLISLAREDFADDGWRSRWSGTEGWVVRDGRLVSAADFSAKLTYRRRLHVPVILEYTGCIQDGQPPGDLSVVWSEAGASERVGRTFQIQAGARDNSYCCIVLQPDGQRLAYSTFKLTPGRDHRFRVEIDGRRFAMAIDGKPVLEHLDRFPSTSGHISLLGWYPGKAFDDVRLQVAAVPEAVPASTSGDALYAFGHFEEAAIMYGRIADGADAGSRLAQDALFRKGMAERRAGKVEASSETWSLLTDPGLVQTADCLRLADILATGQYDLFLERMRAYWRRSPLAHADLRQQWSAAATAIRGMNQPAFAESLLRLRAELFPEDDITGYEAGRVLLHLGRYEEVLRQHADDDRLRVEALLALGRLEKIDRLSGLTQIERVQICQMRGQFASILDFTSPSSYHHVLALCKLGRAAETAVPHPALLYLGRAEELLQRRPLAPAIANECLVQLGRLEEAAGAGIPEIPGSGRDPTARILLGRIDAAEEALQKPLPWLRLMRAVEAGDPAAAGLRAAVTRPRSMGEPWFPGMVIGPWCDLLAGDPGPFDAAMRTMAEWQQAHGQRAWYFARAVLGQIDEQTMLSMPAVVEAQAWWHVASGLRAERQGQAGEAHSAYSAFLALPARQRLLEFNSLNPPIECLVRWRLRALAR